LLEVFMAAAALPRYSRIAALGILTGIRSMSGPALVISRLYAPKRRFFRRRPEPPRTARIVNALAIAESLGDKLPFAPARNATGPLAFRVGIGAAVGVMACRALGANKVSHLIPAALVGGSGAAVGAVGAFRARRWLERSLRLPGLLAGLLEDAVVMRLGGGIFPRAS
jgi:uncharacterized membrane protein